MSSTDTERARAVAGSKTAALANAVVHVMSSYTGRGPTKARGHITGDLVTVLLQDTLTKGERSLVRDGKDNLVLDMRSAYQNTMREDLTSAVENVMGRKVIAFMSCNHIDPDMAIEAFVLEPESEDETRSGS